MQTQSTKLVDNSPTDLVSRFRPQLLALSLVLACFAAHAISIWNGFVLNDHFNMPAMRNIAAVEWPRFWSDLVTQAMIAPFAEPMLKASLALDFLSSGLAPALYHASNILWHAAAVVSAFFLLRRLVPHFNLAQSTAAGAGSAGKKGNGNELIPFIACLLFAVHPLTSDVVAYISGRSPILTFLWYTVALHLWLTGFVPPSLVRGIVGYLFGYLAVLLSLFSSSQAITIPETMVAIGLLIKPATELTKDWVYERASEFGLACFVCLALPFLLLLPNATPVSGGLGLPLLSPTVFYATQLKEIATYYLRAFFVPVPLSIAPPFCLATSLADPFVIAGALILVAAVVMLVRLRKDPFAFLGIWFFLVGLLPQILIVTNEYVSAQRFYLSTFGLCLFATTVFVRYAAKKINLTEGGEIAHEPLLVAPLALVFVVLVGLANYRDHGFATDSAIFRGALRANLGDKDLDKDGYYRALLALMLVYSGANNVDKGLVEARRALDINRQLPLAYLAMARHAILRYDYDGAKFYGEKTKKLAAEQKCPPLVSGLADGCILIAMTEMGQFSDPAKLKALAKSAMAVEPSNSKLYLALGKAIISEHKSESGMSAVVQLDHAKRLDFNDININAPLTEAYLLMGDPQFFERAFNAVNQLHRINATDGSRYLLARAALETGRLAIAAKMLSEVQARNKGNLSAEGWLTMYGVYKQQGETAKAELCLAEAKRIDPEIESKSHLWLKIKPLSSIQQAREEAFEKGTPIQEKFGEKPKSTEEQSKSALKQPKPTEEMPLPAGGQPKASEQPKAGEESKAGEQPKSAGDPPTSVNKAVPTQSR